MNKTLLLVICDFLLLNLLALTNWEQAVPSAPQIKPVVTAPAGAAVATPSSDLVAVMKQSLQDEQAHRDQLTRQLQSAQTTLQQRDQNLAQAANDLTAAKTTLAQTQKTAADLSQKYTAAAQDASLTKEQLAKLQADLAARLAEAERQRRQLDELEKQQTAARDKINSLSVAVQVAQQEKQILAQTADGLRQQVAAEQQQRIQAQQTTTQLAQDVGQLAQGTTTLTQEIRDNRPINSNVLFSDFLANRVQVDFAGTRPGLFGTTTDTHQAHAVLVTDGKDTYALIHIDDTLFNLVMPPNRPTEWKSLRIGLSGNNGKPGVAASTFDFLSLDPRVVAIPLTPAQVGALGVKPYKTALDPFKFPDAVLVTNSGAGYGVVPFKVDASNPGYVRMDSGFVRWISGNFTPSSGDLVLSQSGELLGIMVNGKYCALVNNFLPFQTLPAADPLAPQAASGVINAVSTRWLQLPWGLQ